MAWLTSSRRRRVPRPSSRSCLHLPSWMAVPAFLPGWLPASLLVWLAACLHMPMPRCLVAYAFLPASDPVPQVKTIKQYDLYCHYVAGLVGIGLSKLFASSGEGPRAISFLDLPPTARAPLARADCTGWRSGHPSDEGLCLNPGPSAPTLTPHSQSPTNTCIPIRPSTHTPTPAPPIILPRPACRPGVCRVCRHGRPVQRDGALPAEDQHHPRLLGERDPGEGGGLWRD